MGKRKQEHKDEEAHGKLKLVYFDLRGRAEVSRLILAAAGEKYEDYRYPISKTFERPEFLADKEKGKFPFGQLPVLEVDGRPIAQSHAIERYLAKRFGLFGGDDVEAAQIDALCEQAADIKLKYNDLKKEKKTDEFFEKSLPDMLASVEKLAAANAEHGGAGFLAGKKLSLADILFFHQLRDYYDAKDKVEAVVEKLPALKKVLDTVGAQEGVAKWMKERPDNWM